MYFVVLRMLSEELHAHENRMRSPELDLDL